jgi:uncharacterized protein
MKSIDKAASLPWWRYGHVWLVLLGPVLVVLASLYTGFLALRGADEVMDHPSQVISPAAQRSLIPAHQARNHAATPDAPGGDSAKPAH